MGKFFFIAVISRNSEIWRKIDAIRRFYVTIKCLSKEITVIHGNMAHFLQKADIYTGTGTKFGAYPCPSPTIFKYKMNIYWPIMKNKLTNTVRNVVCIQRKFGSYFQRNVVI